MSMRVRKLSDFGFQNILICVLKINEGIMGLDDMMWVINDRILIVGWTIPLTIIVNC